MKHIATLIDAPDELSRAGVLGVLDVSEMTVKVHVKAILRKIRARNRTQAAIWGVDHLPDALGAEAEIVPDASGPQDPFRIAAARGPE